ncbi:hypothetical protein KY330_00510 [Candidatus Woesearchaeota archaeon]|nr:hypothetical protein [Candidatus Woesearchaeota archaeon]
MPVISKTTASKPIIKPASEAYGIVGFVMGMMSFVSLDYYEIPGIILGIIGIVFSFMQRKSGQTSLGKAGLIVSIVGTAVGILMLVLGGFFYF